MTALSIKVLHVRPIFCVIAIFCLNTAAVFAQEDRNETLVNMKTIPMDQVETLTINSKADLLLLLESRNDKVVVKEYQDDSGKRANPQNADVPSVTSIISSLGLDLEFDYVIESTTRISPSPIDGYIEVYIPPSFRGAFSITSEGGIIRSEVNLNSDRQVDISITNGDLELKQVSARQVNISVSSGSFYAERLIGREINLRHTSGPIEIGEVLGLLSIEALSGPITVRELTGGGNIVTRAGTIDVGLRSIMEDFSCTLTTGNITIATPRDLFFNLDAESKSGVVTVTPPRGSPISTHGPVQWKFGKDADFTISAKVSTGSVAIGPGIDG
jgi:DUF4097 and DUF4098 domain-containing protein YvlB